ncbi:hypothetical protein CPB83DRAFT_892094 [Crepidotus variabilis]|uniref:Zn(2)-C6 fungal-type domain-containing protein n=1 Tax=Crepidotus variabilis TaxID=179855 RepID=A0A9P6JSE7_9AGAR|nr:hypothetical protein CPB83DRAFT_892094 [Crepidotus variabilis]
MTIYGYGVNSIEQFDSTADALQRHTSGYLPTKIFKAQSSISCGIATENNTTTPCNSISSLPHPSVFEQRLKEIQGATPYRSQCDRPGVVSWKGSLSDGVRSTDVNGFWPAHKPIPPEMHSRYSELMPNVLFLQKLEEEEESYFEPTLHFNAPLPPPPPPPIGSSVMESPSTFSDTTSPPPDSPPLADGSLSPTLTAVKFMPTLISVPPAEQSASPPDTTGVPPVTGPIRNVKEPRRPSLACTFCRERKIACGRPPPDAADQTCDQCARRSFHCIYVKDRNRGRSSKQRR